METRALSLEMAMIRVRTHRMMAISVLIHAAAALVILPARGRVEYNSEPFSYTEITWLENRTEPAEQPVSKAARPATAVSIVKEGPARAKKAVSVPPAAGAPGIINDRLVRLQESSLGRRSVAPIMASAAGFPRPSALTAGTAGKASRPPAALDRSERKIVPLEKGSGTAAAALQAAAPAAKRETHDEAKEAKAAFAAEMPGITITGPVADRALMGHSLPEYPEWARRDGIEVSVQLRFTVLPDGRIKENLLVEKTSGFGEFDSNAKTALSGWRFESLGAGEVREQWGRIVFNYRLNKAGRGAEQ